MGRGGFVGLGYSALNCCDVDRHCEIKKIWKKNEENLFVVVASNDDEDGTAV